MAILTFRSPSTVPACIASDIYLPLCAVCAFCAFCTPVCVVFVVAVAVAAEAVVDAAQLFTDTYLQWPCPLLLLILFMFIMHCPSINQSCFHLFVVVSF
jgi:hypothetical protein